MEQISVEELLDDGLSITGVENIENDLNFNDPIDSLDYNDTISCKEKEILDVDETKPKVVMDFSRVDQIDISSDTTDDDDIQSMNQVVVSKQKPAKLSKKENRRYLSSWEKLPEAYYRTYTYDSLNVRQEKLSCWLYKKKDKSGNDTLRCKLCEKYKKTENSNRRPNPWCTTGYRIMRVTKLKEHKDNEVHQQAQQHELEIKSDSQPSWPTTQTKERNKHATAIQNLILPAVYLCQQDQSINSFQKLCTLLEAVDVKLLPAELGGVSYRNDTAALEFLHHVATYLHGEIVEKIKRSPSIGWMLDESTSRTVEKSLIIYVRYFEDGEAKTTFYGILGLDGDGTANNIVNSLKELWEKDDLNPDKTCWFATDNAATFTGVNNGVVAKLKRDLDLDFIELNPCTAHSFALVGSHAGFIKNDDDKTKKRDLISKLESTIGKIYQYFGASATRTFKLKLWQDLLKIPELKFKKLFHIRWTSIRDSIKPIILNITPRNQALLATLEEIKFKKNSSPDDREAAAELSNSILDDNFLFMLHFHYDLHECVLGELTKILQDDDLPYFTFMNVLDEKKKILNNWLSQKNEREPILGPSLNDYLNLITINNSYGAFQVVVSDRSKLFTEVFLHINRLLIEIDKRFKPSEVQERFIVLFEPDYLIQNRNEVAKSSYGRQELDFLRIKYQNLNGFDMDQCKIEWETIKIALSEFTFNNQEKTSRRIFWKFFILWKEALDDSFHERYKNILILLSIYLISPLNSAECERGYSIANRIQTNGRSRIMIETLNILMNVRLHFPDDLRSDRSRQLIQQAYNSWNGSDENRRIYRTKLIIDVPDDYEPSRQVRCSNKRKRQVTTTNGCAIKSKKRKAKAIKCANRCGRYIADDDPEEIHAIQCCHQDEYYEWIQDNCSRWLCNRCRIKLGISTESTSWFCEDCIDMHEEEEE